MKTTLQISIDTDLKVRLDALKERSGVPVSRLITNLLLEHLSNLERRYPPLMKAGDQQRKRKARVHE